MNVLNSLNIPIVVIESDAERRDILNQQKIPTLYGDAGNSEVIIHAGHERARALIITVADEMTSSLIVTVARDINPQLPIIGRATTEEGGRYLSKLGANHIVHLELEGGLEVVHHTLLSLGFPLREVHEFAEAVRRDSYDVTISTGEEHETLHHLLHAIEGIAISWLEIEDSSPIIVSSLAEANNRSQTGASVIRGNQLFSNPKSITVFEAKDRIGLLGEEDQIEAARVLISSKIQKETDNAHGEERFLPPQSEV